MSVHLGLTSNPRDYTPETRLGFRIGIKGKFDDYRDSAVHGKGLDAGVSAAGELFIGKTASTGALPAAYLEKGIKLVLKAQADEGGYTLELSAFALDTAQQLARLSRKNLSKNKLIGNLALVSHRAKAWFSSWSMKGSKIDVLKDRAFGPIMWSQHTLSKGTMKMTAQMPPLAANDSQQVILQIQSYNNQWKTIQTAMIERLSRTALFKVKNWDGSRDIPYRLKYTLLDWEGNSKDHYYHGTVRKDPVNKKEIVVAGFTGNNDLGFPNNDIYNSVKALNPDLLFFSGDQIYEGVGGFGVQREPLDMACLDYLRKWYLYGWVWRDLMRDRPFVSIPDDHDVYHGNIWGCGGKATIKTGTGADQQDSGGYKMPPVWVNMVERTQTAHLPDPFDPAPVKQGISVYYCDMNYGGISFAVIEDRKFKSAPKSLLPEAKIWNGWPQNPDFDVINKADVPGAVLLGDRQLKFLDRWASDWGHGTWMKVVLSQTIFANVATLPRGEKSGSNIPKLRVLAAGEYAPDDHPVNDFDSNSWPQSGRRRALEIMRKAFAFHIAGDQHLGSFIQYGIDEWRDAGFAFCVPAISNIWPRRWYPALEGLNRTPGSPRYTGDFKDGFGNRMTVLAVSNPVFTGKKPARLYDRAAGFGIVRFIRSTRGIIAECWPRGTEARKPGSSQYPGWPLKLNQLDNYNRKTELWLPEIQVKGKQNPVIQIIDQSNGEIVYTLRIKGGSFRPKVFKHGIYTIKVGEPDTGKFKVFKDVKSLGKDRREVLWVDL